MGTGIGLAVPTCGASLISTAYGYRRNSIATRKHAMVAAQLETREGKDHCQERKRDWIIPTTVGVATLGLGFDLDQPALEATSTAVSSELIAGHGMAAAQSACANPTGFVHGVVDGVTTQTHQLSHVATEGLNQASMSAAQTSGIIMTECSQTPVAVVVGESMGAGLAQAAEKAATEAVVSVVGKIMPASGTVVKRKAVPKTQKVELKRKPVGSVTMETIVVEEVEVKETGGKMEEESAAEAQDKKSRVSDRPRPPYEGT
jgi:hypothetical protein